MDVLSVDGGATKTIAIVHNDDGTILGVGVSGPTNYRNVGEEEFERNLLGAVEKAKSNSGVSHVGEYTFALAGMKDSKKSSEKIIGILKRLIPNGKISFYNDGEAGFYSRFPEGNGIVVAPGTGMVSYGSFNGKVERSSGWGWFLDDEGGAFYIGRRALQETVKLMDLRDERNSVLPNFVREYFGLKADRDIINRVYERNLDIRGIALLSQYVSKFAKGNDPIAMEIMRDAADETAKAAVSIYKRFGSPLEIAFSGYGGVLKAGEWYWDIIKTGIESKIGTMIFRHPLFGYEAILGSIVLRFRDRGIQVDESRIEEMRNQLSKLINQMDESDRKKYLLM